MRLPDAMITKTFKQKGLLGLAEEPRLGVLDSLMVFRVALNRHYALTWADPARPVSARHCRELSSRHREWVGAALK